MNSKPKPDLSALTLLRQPGFLGRNLRVVVSKAASLAILATLVLAVWVAFSFVRISVAGSIEPAAASSGATISAPTRSLEISNPAAGLGKRESLVYVTEGDAQHFHLSGHNPTGAARQAIPCNLARSRGFKACQVCFRE